MRQHKLLYCYEANTGAKSIGLGFLPGHKLAVLKQVKKCLDLQPTDINLLAHLPRSVRFKMARILGQLQAAQSCLQEVRALPKVAWQAHLQRHMGGSLDQGPFSGTQEEGGTPNTELLPGCPSSCVQERQKVCPGASAPASCAKAVWEVRLAQHPTGGRCGW